MMGSLFEKHHLQKKYYPQFYAYYYKQWNNYKMDFHRHDSIEMMYVINGQCTIELIPTNTSETFALLLKKGEFILLDGNCPHKLLVDEQVHCRMLNIEFSFAQGEHVIPSISELAKADADLQQLLQTKSSYIVLRDVDEVYGTLKSLVLELDNHQSHNELKKQLLFSQLMLAVAQLTQVYQSSHSSQHRAAAQYVKKVIASIQQNYDQQLNVTMLAQAVNVHPNYLHRIFRSHMGMTIVSYLNEYRVEKAKMLLRETDIPISDICEYVGISNRQYFHTLFKKIVKMTPVEYRMSSNRQKYDHR